MRGTGNAGKCGGNAGTDGTFPLLRIRQQRNKNHQPRQRRLEGQQFYQTYFQMPGMAEKEFDADPKGALRMFLYSLSGSIPKEHKWRYLFGINEKALDGCVDPKQLPEWLKPEDLDYYANE